MTIGSPNSLTTAQGPCSHVVGTRAPEDPASARHGEESDRCRLRSCSGGPTRHDLGSICGPPVLPRFRCRCMPVLHASQPLRGRSGGHMTRVGPFFGAAATRWFLQLRAREHPCFMCCSGILSLCPRSYQTDDWVVTGFIYIWWLIDTRTFRKCDGAALEWEGSKMLLSVLQAAPFLPRHATDSFR